MFHNKSGLKKKLNKTPLNETKIVMREKFKK